MKKLLLSLGSLSTAILPIVAIASCSTNTPAPTLETEKSRFDVSTKAKDNNLTTNEAVDLINKQTKPEEKLASLKTFANVPTPNRGFLIEVQSATINQAEPTSIYVKINVKEEATLRIQEATFIVTDLTAKLLTLEEEFARFNISTQTINIGIKAIDIVDEIQKASSPMDKLIKLKTVANVPKESTGFFIEVKSAIVNADVLSSIEVKIMIEEVATQKQKDATFTVTGLIEEIPTLSDEVAKFTPRATRTPSVAAGLAATQITTAVNDNAKLEALKILVELPKISNDFEIKVHSASVNAEVFTTLDVKIIIVEKITKDYQGLIFQVTGMKETLPTLATEVAKLASPVKTISPFWSPQYVKTLLDASTTDKEKYQTLQTFADLWDLSTGYTATFGEITINATTNTSISIKITVTDTSLTADNSQMVTFVITDLAPKTLDEQENKFTSIATQKAETITAAIESINNAASPEEKLAALKVFATPPTLDDNFTMEVLVAQPNPQTPTSMNVLITITQSSHLTTETLTSSIAWVITGFTEGAPA